MSSVDDFGVRVNRRRPSAARIVAPERDVVTGRYTRDLDRDAKHRRTETDQSARPRRIRPRRIRPWQIAATGVTVAAVAGATIAVAGSGGGGTGGGETATTTSSAAPVAAASPPSATGASDATASTTPGGTVSSAAASPTAAAGAVTPESLTGEYRLSMTIVDGNTSLPVGTTQETTISFTAECVGGTCTLSSPEFAGAPWSVNGGGLSASFSVTEACPNNPGQSVETLVEVSLEVTGRDAQGLPTGLSGTQYQETPGAAACGGDTINDPITWEIDGSRIE